MKTVFGLILIMLSANALATVDIQGNATIVVKNYHSDGNFRDAYFLQVVPTDFCVGILPLTLADAITKPVMIKSNYGCGHSGDMVGDSQVNAATCAVVTAEEIVNSEGELSNSTVKVSMDVSGCGEKAQNKFFVNTLIDAIYSTYNSSGYQVVGLPNKSYGTF